MVFTSAITVVAMRTVPCPEGIAHCKDENEVQLIDAHFVMLSIVTVGVVSLPPKLRPMTDTIARPVLGPLNCLTKLATGESYVKTVVMVPGTESMESTALNAEPVPYGEAHATEVSVDQIDVKQLDAPSSAVGVESLKPKFFPEKVTMVPPEDAPFSARMKDATGESKENTPKRVPTSASIVATRGIELPKPSSR